MRPAFVRVAIWGPLVILALLLAAYVVVHQPLAPDDAELRQVALDPNDPLRQRVGDLVYRGGLDIPRMGENIGGLSGLRWDADSERLLAITDDARWVWFSLQENDDWLTGIEGVEVGNLLGFDGEVLTGKERGDSESLTHSVNGGWLIGFERDHRIWRYPALDQAPDSVPFDPEAPLPDPQELLGDLDENSGVEGLAGNEMLLIACAERSGTSAKPNCVEASQDGRRRSFVVAPPADIAEQAAVPTDIDTAENGRVFVLLRSYSPAFGNTVSIVAIGTDGTHRNLMTLLPPLTVDNFEGLAVREEEDRTFVYIVSDDNFSGGQRTLLMKFEVMPKG